MATEQELIEGLRRADAAGDAQGAQAFASELKRVRSASKTPWYGNAPPTRQAARQAPPQPTFGQSLVQSGKAMGRNLLKGAAALPDLLASGGEAASDGISNVIAGVGDAVIRPHSPSAATAFTNFVAPTKLKVPMLGDRAEALFPQSEAPDTSKSMAFAQQMLGGALLPMGPKAGQASRPPVGAPWRAAAPKNPAKGLTPPPTRVIPNAAEVVKAGNQAGVRVLTSDIRPPRTFMGKGLQTGGERIPIAGTGGPRAAQQAERVKAVRDALEEFGGQEVRGLYDDAPRAIDEIASGIATKRGADVARLSNAKNAVINGLPGSVPATRAVAAIGEQIRNLSSINAQAYAPVISRLQEFGLNLTQGKSLSQIEGNRRLLGEMFSDPSLASLKTDGQKAINAIYGPLREDMATFIKQTGGDAAHSQWSNANNQLAAMAGELNNTAFRRALQTSEMTPENVGKLLFSKNRSDVERLYKNLDTAGRSKMQAAVLQKAFDNAVGTEGLSVERFLGNLDNLGESVGVAFRGADRDRMVGLSRMLDATRRGAAASAHPPTGVQNNSAVMGFTLGNLFGGAAIPITATGGLLARAYESAPVRDMFIRLAKTKPGSPAERQIMTSLSRTMQDIGKRHAGALPVAANQVGQPSYGVAAFASPEEEQQKQQRGF